MSDHQERDARVSKLIEHVEAHAPGEPEFHQAVREAAPALVQVVSEHPELEEVNVLERIVEPDRVVGFRVCWQDDDGRVQVNRGWRVQFSNAIGPYKGGLRFHPSVNVGVLKFLGFEQTLKNALTGFPLGGAKGGSDFDPKGRCDAEVMRFCQALMGELHRHIGEDTDVPAGDIGVGAREVGYLFGEYKRVENRHVGVLTGKGLEYGGSHFRSEATGYGLVYFMREMLKHRGEELEGRTALVSGAGNVALHCIEKLIDLDVEVKTFSDSTGCIVDPDGVDAEKLAWLRELREERRGSVEAYADEFGGATFHEGKRPWGAGGELAFPCATQNEVSKEDAEALVEGGCIALAEGANMPTETDAVAVLRAAKVLYGPGKAANAGGVAVSALEQTQNAARLSWDPEEVDERLREVMSEIHERCSEGQEDQRDVDYGLGANRAGFLKVARAMRSQGF